jgi:sigma-B regulation protein RsbU (phosphoserine phosphatase)
VSAGRSFSTRLIAAVTLVAGAIIAGGLYLDYRIARARILEELAANTRAAIDGATARIGEMANGVEAAVRTVGDALEEVPSPEAADRLLGSLVSSNPHVTASALALAPEIAGAARGYAPYRYRLPGGRSGVLGRADLADAPKPYWEEVWFRLPRDTGAGLWVEPYVETTGLNASMITFAVPVYGAAGASSFIGVVTADVTLATLEPYLDDLALDSAGFGFLLSSSGVLIGAPVDEVVGQELTTVFPGIAAPRQETVPPPAASSGFVEAVPCPREEGECTLRLRPVGIGNWSVGVVYSEDRMLRPLQAYALRTLTIGLGMLVMLAVLISVVTRRLTRPLISLADASGAIARGDLDVALPEVRSNDEVGTLVGAFDRMRTDLAGYIDEVARNAAQRSRLEGEMAAAAEIQRAMLPQGGQAEYRADGLALWAALRPARAVGGDLYSFNAEGGQLRFAIGDVSDKGVAAALFMARAIALIGQWEAQQPAVPPHVALRQINASLSQDNERCMFVTLTLGILDPASGRLCFASAGHCAPLLLRNACVAEVPQERGPPLALAEDLAYPDNVLELAAGDRLIFYTDGFDEAQNPDDEAFGLERLRAQVEESEDRPLPEAGSRLFQAIETFADGRGQHDDMTLLQIDVPGADRTPLQADFRAFRLNDALVADTRSWLEEHWRSQGLDEERLGELCLIVEELVCNVRSHSGLGAGDELSLGLERFSDRVELVCSDAGRPFDPLTQSRGAELGLDTDAAAIGGLGVHLVKRLTDEQFYRREDGHNILRLRIGLAPAERFAEAATPAAKVSAEVNAETDARTTETIPSQEGKQ